MSRNIEQNAEDLRLVLVGLSGVGKSAAGNTILGKEMFKSQISSSSLTQESERREGVVCGRRVAVVDTPGLFNTELSEDRLREEMGRGVSLCDPGPHAFLLVIQLGRFTQQEKRVMETLQELFSERVNQYTVVLFTYGDRLEDTTIEEFISEDTNLQQLLEKCGYGYHVFNNDDNNSYGKKDSSVNNGNTIQVNNLFEKVDKMVSKNNPSYYKFYQQRNFNLILSKVAGISGKVPAALAWEVVGAVGGGILGQVRGAVVGCVGGAVVQLVPGKLWRLFSND